MWVKVKLSKTYCIIGCEMRSNTKLAVRLHYLPIDFFAN